MENAAALNYSQKHPALLPKSNHFTQVLARDLHIRNLHPGPQLLLSLLRQEYWIPRGKDSAKETFKKCMVCFRHNANPSPQLMGNFPAARVNCAPPFSPDGEDYARPFQVSLRTGPEENHQFKRCMSLCSRVWLPRLYIWSGSPIYSHQPSLPHSIV